MEELGRQDIFPPDKGKQGYSGKTERHTGLGAAASLHGERRGGTKEACLLPEGACKPPPTQFLHSSNCKVTVKQMKAPGNYGNSVQL